MEGIENKRTAILFGLSLFVLMSLIILLFFYEREQKRIIIEDGVQRAESGTKHITANLNLEAQAVYVFDTKTNTVLYAKNAEAQLPLASLTKLMTAIVSSNDGALALARTAGERAEIEIKEKTLSQKSSVEQFITLMNEKARAIGLEQTYFLNP